MATWFTVYCTKSVQAVTPQALVEHLRGPRVDWYMLAENFGFDEDEVADETEDSLEAKSIEGDLGEWLEVKYQPKKGRPLKVYLWSESARVQQELTEAEGNFLADRTGKPVNQIRKKLEDVIEVLAIELSTAQLGNMGIVVAGQIAEYFCDVGAGIIRDTNDDWWTVKKGIPKLILGNGTD